MLVALPYQKLLIPLCCRLNTNLLFGCVKLIGYFAFAVHGAVLLTFLITKTSSDEFGI